MRSTARAPSSSRPARPRRPTSSSSPRRCEFEQLTNAELLVSAPGPHELKRNLLNCTDCHSLHRIFELEAQPRRFQESVRTHGHLLSRRLGHAAAAARRRAPAPGSQSGAGGQLRRLSRKRSISAAARRIASSSRPRRAPTGRATRVIITEYDLPRKEIQPHDVIVDGDGGVWFSHFGEQFLSKLDPVTGKVTDFPIPVLKPDHPKGTLDLEIDPGRLYLGRHDVPGRHGAVRPQDRDSSASIRCRRNGRPTPPSSRTSRWRG